MPRLRLHERLRALSARRDSARFHFLRDYDRLVTVLLKTHRREDAMALAVGGDFQTVGAIECALLRYAGLADEMSLIDFGCGSGRLASALGRQGRPISYYGIDINRTLLDHAKSISPPEFRFALNRTLTVPAPDESADMISAFSVFTHLKHAETYIYLGEMHRVLRPGGRLVFSFLEFASPRHWSIFDDTVDAERSENATHLNQFIERNVIDLWSDRIGFHREAFIGDDEAPWGDPHALGQSVAILVRR